MIKKKKKRKETSRMNNKQNFLPLHQNFVNELIKETGKRRKREREKERKREKEKERKREREREREREKKGGKVRDPFITSIKENRSESNN